ncbi:ribosomal subunit interface protein [Candidatus Arthromitus sp. SFB-mouse-Japan]|uniref:ribosome hibernation-promoting factor, HPF/YfiA family n=1 Tax=unclassified Candidatus Neoarthromitus TaxID=2638829 RepID=UPI00021B821A|nr:MULTISPECIES: ribosome-associated translation inhibitor RaiA [unclassified Candidatus Arthromitus]EIA21696.1 SSU ribosomal protein S30P [Candidatus Arthromitus sp. SFB-3]EIA21945.1 SSU ribosomal protein S30P [Candidatus Arthromitus sp. SFB-2]EIA26979.1 SSU ribosomal protein S30P [Candidatus Arthromitus sp. SFB-co]EIA28180.1 SSU ribosomal protein S30P [Candidatus Arthromitus sp. SFB-4]EIA30043.1 SSU ribosomal protein S30P [Candidatus Arthromitus sp. SFB-mouse-SU]EIA31619.1 SSU ribosomal pro
MKIVIHGKNIEVTRALEDAINKKLSKLDNYFSQELEAHVTLSVEKNNQIIEVGILFNGIYLRAQERNSDLYIAIDLVVDKLYKQIRRQKTKLVKKYSNKDIRSLDILLDNIENDDLEDDIIIKVKKFPIKPMYKDEAILQMELIGHDFYVFINAETNDVNVLYRRKSGNYGLIEAEY